MKYGLQQRPKFPGNKKDKQYAVWAAKKTKANKFRELDGNNTFSTGAEIARIGLQVWPTKAEAKAAGDFYQAQDDQHEIWIHYYLDHRGETPAFDDMPVGTSITKLYEIINPTHPLNVRQ